MRFALNVKYRYADSNLEVKHEHVASLGRRDVWGSASREGALALCQPGGVAVTAAYVTGVFMKKTLCWVAVNTSENTGALFDLDIPDDRESEFQELIASDELKRLLNKELSDQDNTEQAELNIFDDCIRNLRIAGVSIVAKTQSADRTKAKVHATGIDSAEGHPIQILKEGYDLEIDQEALEAILTHPKIGNRMVSLVSIAGAFRQGKSFMLNFFLRYLRQKGYESNDESWLGNPDTLLDNGFEWRGGIKPHTSGIVIWSEPFIVSRGSEEVAIFLIDTQGEFDNRATRARSTNILAINFLLSSTVIYNVQEIIKGNDIENLEFCTWYTEEIKTDLNPFQNFWFLVRDWLSTDEFELGHLGGREYLETEVLRANDLDHPALVSMRQQIRKSFECMQCYLMPFPGEAVRKMRKNANRPCSIHLKDIDAEFLSHVAKFADMLLNPKNLTVKPMKAQNLLNFIIKCCESINSENVVAPETILQNVLNARVIELREECMTMFDDEMTKAIPSDAFMPWKEFDETADQVRDAAWKRFSEKITYGGDDFKSRHKEQVSARLLACCKKYRKKNLLQESKKKQDTGDLVVDCCWHYKNKLNRILLDVPVDNPESFLGKSTTVLQEEILEEFRRRAKERGLDSEIDEQEGFLRDAMEDEFDLAKLHFQLERDKLKYKLFEIVCDSVELYEKTMVEGDNPAGYHQKAEKMAYSHFHAHKPKAIAESMLKEGKDKLKQLMGGARAVLEEELSRKALRNTALDELHSQYDENVKMQTEGKIVTEEMLRSLKQEIPFSQITATADIGVDDIEKQKDNAMKRNVQRNKLLMEKKNVELGKRKQDIVDGILWRTEKTDNFYVDGEELDKNLSEMKEQSIESLETSIQQHFLSKEDCSDHVRNGLRHVLDVVSTVFRRRNKRYEVVMNSMLEMQKLRIMIDYSEEMGKVLQDKYLDPDGLDALHNETADAIVPDFTNEKTPLFLMKHGVRVRQELDQELEKYKEINEENKPFYRQVAGKASGALGAMGVAAGGAAGGFILAEVLVTAAVVTGAASVGIGALGVLVVGAGTYISKRIREKRFEELRLQIKCTLREDAKKLIKKLQQ